MTLEEVEQKIQELQNQLAQGQAQLQQLIGYRQALVDQGQSEEAESENGTTNVN